MSAGRDKIFGAKSLVVGLVRCYCRRCPNSSEMTETVAARLRPAVYRGEQSTIRCAARFNEDDISPLEQWLCRLIDIERVSRFLPAAAGVGSRQRCAAGLIDNFWLGGAAIP